MLLDTAPATGRGDRCLCMLVSLISPSLQNLQPTCAIVASLLTGRRLHDAVWRRLIQLVRHGRERAVIRYRFRDVREKEEGD